MTDTSLPTENKPNWRWLVWLFAAIGVLAALALIWLVMMLGSSKQRHQPAQVAAQAQNEVWAVGAVDPLDAMNLVLIRVDAPEGTTAVGSYKGRYNDQRNLLFLNSKTGEVHRLLPDNKTHITSVELMPAAATAGERYGRSERPADGKPPAYYVARLESPDGKSTDLLVGQLDGYRQAVVMRGLNGIDKIWMIDDHQLGVILREKERLYFRVVDIPAQKVVSSQKIDIG